MRQFMFSRQNILSVARLPIIAAQPTPITSKLGATYAQRATSVSIWTLHYASQSLSETMSSSGGLSLCHAGPFLLDDGCMLSFWCWKLGLSCAFLVVPRSHVDKCCSFLRWVCTIFVWWWACVEAILLVVSLMVGVLHVTDMLTLLYRCQVCIWNMTFSDDFTGVKSTISFSLAGKVFGLQNFPGCTTIVPMVSSDSVRNVAVRAVFVAKRRELTIYTMWLPFC